MVVTTIAIAAEDAGGGAVAWKIVVAQVPTDPAVAVPARKGAGGGGTGTLALAGTGVAVDHTIAATVVKVVVKVGAG